MIQVFTEGAEKSFDSELINTIKQGKNQEIASIIENYPVKKLIDSNRTHLLHVAAEYNNIELIDFLVKNGCKPNVKDATKMTPLLTAILHKNFEAAKFLHTAHINLLNSRLAKPNFPQNYFDYLKDEWRKLEIPLVKDLVREMKKRQISSERIGEALAKVTGCVMHDVVYFRDPVISKAFDLQTSHLSCHDAFEIVNPTFDLQHIRVLLYDPHNDKKAMFWFCSDLMNNIEKYHETRSGRSFLKEVFSCEIFKEENLKDLEKVLKNSKSKSVKIFLKYNFHVVVKAKYGRDILACLFGNRDPTVITLLTDEQIDVDGRGYGGKTSLYFAAKQNLFDNVQMLLDKGADPNAFNEKQETPLTAALFKFPTAEDGKCVKLLLQYGGNILLISKQFENHSYFYLSEIHYPFRINIVECIVAQLVINEVLGQSIEEASEIFMKWCTLNLERIFDDCRQQINKLKTRDIWKSSNDQMTRKKELTVFTILTEKPENIACYISDEELQAISKFAESNEETLILYYRDLFEKRVECITKLYHCRRVAIQVVCQLIGIQNPHNLIVGKIVNYLNARDLHKFTVKPENENLSIRTEVQHWFKRKRSCIFKF